MKGFLLFGALIALPVSASDSATQSLQGYRVGACTSWVYNSGGSMPGYMCSSFPTTVVVADAYKYAEVIRALESRVAELEKQVAELKEKAGN